jgi:hypothetical protein
MQTQTLNAIAAAFRKYTDEALRVGDRTAYGALVATAATIGDHFREEHPGFDYSRFMLACGGPRVD